MKYLRVKIKRSANAGGGTHYTYPPQYDATKVRFGPNYETFNPSKLNGVKSRADSTELCVIAVKDVDAPAFLASPDITAINEAQFKKELDENSAPQANRITDPEAVLKVTEKVTKGQPLTAQDKEVIDPSKAKGGVNRNLKSSERFTAAKASLE